MLGNGGARVTAKAFSGNIHIRRGAAAGDREYTMRHALQLPSFDRAGRQAGPWHRYARPLFFAVSLTLLAATADAQESDTWEWSGTLGAGRTVYVHNVNGAVRIEAGSGNVVEVRAVKRWRRGNPEMVRTEARMSSGGNGDVIICALNTPRATCDADGIRHNNDRSGNRSNDVRVEFVIQVPANAEVEANTVNGELSIRGVRGDVRANTVNGNIDARSTAGRVWANTVNGSITVAGIVDGGGVEYGTVNGSITIELPSDANARVDLSTVNGRIATEFPITVDGTILPRRIRADIGSGGGTLRARTVNGGIRLRKM